MCTLICQLCRKIWYKTWFHCASCFYTHSTHSLSSFTTTIITANNFLLCFFIFPLVACIHGHSRIEAISPRVIHSFQKIMIIITVIQSSNEFYYTSNNKSLNAYIITTRAIVLRYIPCTLTSYSSSLKPPLSLLLHAQLSYLKENISTFIRLLCLHILINISSLLLL